jgi:hypothetical protein
LEFHPYAFSVVVDFVVVVVVVVVVLAQVVVVPPPPFSSSDLDFAHLDSSAVTVKRVRFETSPRVTSESLPSGVVVVVVAFSLDYYCALAPSCFSRLGNRKRRSRYSLGKTKDEENKVQNLLSHSHSVSTPFNGKKRREMFSDV